MSTLGEKTSPSRADVQLKEIDNRCGTFRDDLLDSFHRKEIQNFSYVYISYKMVMEAWNLEGWDMSEFFKACIFHIFLLVNKDSLSSLETALGVNRLFLGILLTLS